MNSCLMMLLQENADLIPSVRPDCEKNFEAISQLLADDYERADAMAGVEEEEEEGPDGAHQRSAKSFVIRKTATRKSIVGNADGRKDSNSRTNSNESSGLQT